MAERVPINGKRLREDREDRGISREALIAKITELTGQEVSLSTLRRAEDESIASKQTLTRISSAIGFPPERYLIEPARDSTWRTNFDLNGEWQVYYLEDDVGTEPYVAIERLFVTHDGSQISGTYEAMSSRHPDGYMGSDAFLMNGHVAENVIMGRYFVDGRAHPRGAGVYQLLLLRNGCWAEGVCTFFGDDGRVTVCTNIWIKKGSAEFSLMVIQAERAIREHEFLFKAPFST